MKKIDLIRPGEGGSVYTLETSPGGLVKDLAVHEGGMTLFISKGLLEEPSISIPLVTRAGEQVLEAMRESGAMTVYHSRATEAMLESEGGRGVPHLTQGAERFAGVGMGVAGGVPGVSGHYRLV